MSVNGVVPRPVLPNQPYSVMYPILGPRDDLRDAEVELGLRQVLLIECSDPLHMTNDSTDTFGIFLRSVRAIILFYVSLLRDFLDHSVLPKTSRDFLDHSAIMSAPICTLRDFKFHKKKLGKNGRTLDAMECMSATLVLENGLCMHIYVHRALNVKAQASDAGYQLGSSSGEDQERRCSLHGR